MAERGLAIHRTSGDPWGTARALTTLGLLSRDSVGRDRAEAYYRESIAVQKGSGDCVVVVPYSLAGLGYLMTERGEYTEGLRLLLDGLALSERRGDASTQELCLQQIGWVHYKIWRLCAGRGVPVARVRLAAQLFTYAENWNHSALGGILLEQRSAGRGHCPLPDQPPERERAHHRHGDPGLGRRGLRPRGVRGGQAPLPREPGQLRARGHGVGDRRDLRPIGVPGLSRGATRPRARLLPPGPRSRVRVGAVRPQRRRRRRSPLRRSPARPNGRWSC